MNRPLGQMRELIGSPDPSDQELTPEGERIGDDVEDQWPTTSL